MTSQTFFQLCITIAIIAVATFLTRALPFLLFPDGKKRRVPYNISAPSCRALPSPCSSYTALKMFPFFPAPMACRS